MMQALRKLFLDERHQTPRPEQTAGRRRGIATPPPPATNHSMLWGGGITVAIAALILSIIFSDQSDGGSTGIATNPKTLCPLHNSDLAGETYVHIDLSETLSEEQREWLQDLLRVAVDSDLPPHSLFSISQMQTVANAPRVEVQRFCIPDITGIGDAGISVEKENCQAIAEEEFDWKQNRTRNVGKASRKKITTACTAYISLKAKVEEAADRYKNVSLGQDRSYIVGGIEEVMHAAEHAANPDIPTRLIVFSDMLQNAKWFSQYNTPADDWTANNLKKLRKSEAAVKEMGGKPPPADIKFNSVLLCYIPSNYPILASARNQKAHRKMWEEYFENKVTQAEKFQAQDASACATALDDLMRK